VTASPAISFCEEVYGFMTADQIVDALEPLEAAAIAYDWETWWARPEQLIPYEGEWLTWGLLTGRGFGKTTSAANFFVREIKAGRARHICLTAQTDAEAYGFMVAGEAGLLAESPPWFPARWIGNDQLVVWPNGAIARVMTPYEPGPIRGYNFDHEWNTEVCAWPKTTRDETISNIEFATRVDPARSIWDTTPKRRDTVLKDRIERSEQDPKTHVIVRGKTDDNRHSLHPARLADLHRKHDGTQKGREELGGEYSADDEGALWQQGWIDRSRRHMPSKLRRRILIIDPAITKTKGSDQTGISELGLGIDDQVYVIGDYTKKYRPEEWGDVVLEHYEAGQCDCVVAETNRGGDLVVSMLRARAESRERIETGRTLKVIQVEPDAPTRWVPGVVYVKVVHAHVSKQERASPVAALYEQGQVSHVYESRTLEELEDLLCTWVPDPKNDSPDRMDPMVWGVWELKKIKGGKRKTQQKGAITQALAAQKKIDQPKRGNAADTLLERLRAMGGRRL
jgi:phage terminase large subunit-like protein